MVRYMKKTILMCLAALLLTGCGDKESADTSEVKPETDAEEELSLNEQGMELLEKGEYDEAVLVFEQALQEEEDPELAHRGIGIARMAEEEYELAIESFEEALSFAGAEAGALEYDISYYKAAALVRLERLNDAILVYNNLIEYKPESRTYIGRGAVYARLGNVDMARADFDMAVSEHPENYDQYIEIFRMLEAAGRADVGEEYLKQALSVNKEAGKYNLEKGKVYYYLGQYEKSRTELEKVKDDGEAEVLLYLARVYEALGDFSYAQTLYREYLEKDSADGNIYNMIAVSEINAGDYQGALATLQEGIEKAEYGKQNLYRNEIAAYEALLDFNTAKQKMEQYLEKYPDDEEAAREYIFLKTRSR